MKKQHKLRIIKDNITERNMKFENICLKTQNQLKKDLAFKLKNMGEVVNETGFLFRRGKLPILLVAHLDTVHKETPKEIVYANGTISSTEGIGGDDRCGVYMILEILKKHDCYVVFTEDEEVGGIGARLFAKSRYARELKGKINYVIEMDRMNSNDAVFYECDNPEFEDFITEEHWVTSYGSYSDICEICPEIGVAGVNLSCGYYNQHKKDEHVNLNEMEKNIEEICKLIERTTEKDKFEYIEMQYPSNFYNYSKYSGTRSYWDNYYDENFYIFFLNENKDYVKEIIKATSQEEALGYWMIKHPKLCYDDVYEVFDETEYWTYMYDYSDDNYLDDNNNDDDDEIPFKDIKKRGVC